MERYVYITAGSDKSTWKLQPQEIPKHHVKIITESTLEHTINQALLSGAEVISHVSDIGRLAENYRNHPEVHAFEADSDFEKSLIHGLERFVDQLLIKKGLKPIKGKKTRKNIRAHLAMHGLLKTPILVVGGDSLFISKTDFDELFNAYGSYQEKPDIFVSIADTSEAFKFSKALQLGIDSSKTTLFNSTYINGNPYRIRNMYMFTLDALTSNHMGLLNPVYKHRKLSKWVNKIAMTYIGLSHLIPNAYRPFGQYIKSCCMLIRDIRLAITQIKGKAKHLSLNIDPVLQNASYLFNLKINLHYSKRLGPLLDIDDQFTYDLFRKHAEEIKTYLGHQ